MEKWCKSHSRATCYKPVKEFKLEPNRILAGQLPTFAADYGIRSVPTLVLVKNDEIIDQRVGGLPPQQLMQWLEQQT